MRRIQDIIANLELRFGDKADPSKILECDRLAVANIGGPRVIIETTYSNGTKWRRAGVISTTTGWQPALIVMHNVCSISSGDVLGPNDKVVAIQTERGYRCTKTYMIVKANLGYTEPEA